MQLIHKHKRFVSNFETFVGMQRADGAFGAFIVRVPEEKDPHCDLYDFDLNEHVIILLDWGQEHGLQKFIAHHHSDGDNKPQTLLVNGLGRYESFKDDNNETIYIPTARFVVEQVNKRKVLN